MRVRRYKRKEWLDEVMICIYTPFRNALDSDLVLV